MDTLKQTRSERKKHAAKRVKNWWRIWKSFKPFAKPHRPEFLKSLVAALAVVGLRLCFPWPIRYILKPWLNQEGAGASLEMSSALIAGGIFFTIVVCFGFAEFRQRVHVARFSIAWVRDIRAKGFRAANKIDAKSLTTSSGDMVARLVGDTARLKAGLKGFLTHVANNGFLFIGVSFILLWVDPYLGAIIAIAGASVFLVTLSGAKKLYDHYLKLRKKEGKLATRIQDALNFNPLQSQFAKVNYSSGVHETNVVKIQGRTTLAAHAILGFATILALLVAAHGLQTGRTSPDGILIFFLYLLDLHRPAVRLSRQGTRIGKMMACGYRLERLLNSAKKSKSKSGELGHLNDSLSLQKVLVEGRGRNRLGPLDISIPVGQHIAIVGKAGSGKSTFLKAVACREKVHSGKIFWDEHRLDKIPASALFGRVSYMPDNPSWIRQKLSGYLGLSEDERHQSETNILEATGAGGILRRLPLGINETIASSKLSRRERRAITLAKTLLERSSLILLDDAFADLTPGLKETLLEILQSNPSTIVAVIESPEDAKFFDRVIEIQRGRVLFDGDTENWLGLPSADVNKHNEK